MAVQKTIYCIVIVSLVAGFGWPIGSQAGTSVINNDIQVEADTSGNNANRIEKGEAKASVDIKTEVNGKTVEDTSIRKEDDDSIDIKAKSQIVEKNGVVEKKTTTNINGEEKTSESEIELKGKTGKADSKREGPVNNTQSSQNNPQQMDETSQDKTPDTSADQETYQDDVGFQATEEDAGSQGGASVNKSTQSEGENRLQTGHAAVMLSSLWDWITSGFSKVISYFV